MVVKITNHCDYPDSRCHRDQLSGKIVCRTVEITGMARCDCTVLSSMLGGPIIGAASGIVNNLVYGVTVDPISTVYAITQGAIGLVVGVMAFKGWLSSFK